MSPWGEVAHDPALVRRRPALAWLLAVLLGIALLGVGTVDVGPASAQNGVGVSTPVMINSVGSSAGIGAGQRLRKTVPHPRMVEATGVAADDAPAFFRGARSGEPPSFAPRPNEFKVDRETGFVRDTHGVSVFDNPESVASKGFTPHQIDPSTVPDELRIIQQGQNPHHFEIVPQPGANLTPDGFAACLAQIGCF